MELPRARLFAAHGTRRVYKGSLQSKHELRFHFSPVFFHLSYPLYGTSLVFEVAFSDSLAAYDTQCMSQHVSSLIYPSPCYPPSPSPAPRSSVRFLGSMVSHGSTPPLISPPSDLPPFPVVLLVTPYVPHRSETM